MSEKEFNLLHEPWIMVMGKEGETKEVSMLEAFQHAHQYKQLAGELPTQDVAVMRLLLAVLHAVFARYDEKGSFASLESPGEAVVRWKSLWEKESFPFGIIEKYLNHYQDKFYLFHPEHPFYQVPTLAKATSYTAAKLNGELSESSNKIRLFPQRSGNNKQVLSYPEAARWLLYVNAFDDTASKPTQKGLLSPGAGWLGKLGLINAVGMNLFETLMLNLVLLKDGTNELWGSEKPLWEHEKIKNDERTEVVMPDNLSQLYTLQSRRLSLQREGKKVVGYDLVGGDFFPKENALYEQMSLWRNAAKKDTDPPEYTPRRHDPAKQLWRDFSVLMGYGQQYRTPGLIKWLSKLANERIIPRTHYQFQTAGVKYGDKDFFVDDVFADNISFSAELLMNLGESWVQRIIEEIEVTNRLADQVGQLAQNLTKASGDTNGNGQKSMAKELAYYRVDQPFRQWLANIEPEKDEDKKEDLSNDWWNQAQAIIRQLGSELVYQAGPQSFTGRVVFDQKKNREFRYTAPEVFNRFLINTNSRDALNRVYKKED